MIHMGLSFNTLISPLNAELNPICHLLALLGAHPILHVNRIRVNMVYHYCYYSTVTMMLIMLNTRVTGYNALAHCPPPSPLPIWGTGPVNVFSPQTRTTSTVTQNKRE